MLGGSIAVESEYGKGSAFTMTLPARRSDRRRAQPAPAPPESAIGTVLVVDDERRRARRSPTQLGGDGYRVLAASGGKDGLRLASRSGPTPSSWT